MSRAGALGAGPPASSQRPFSTGIRRASSGADLARLEIDFRAGDSGCRAVSWRYIYDDGAHEDVSTLVCP